MPQKPSLGLTLWQQVCKELEAFGLPPATLGEVQGLDWTLPAEILAVKVLEGRSDRARGQEA